MKIRSNVNIDINIDDEVWALKATFTKEEFIKNFNEQMQAHLISLIREEEAIEVDVKCKTEFVD
jgi:hypothetical protein